MAARGGYGQYCGLARALETIGERWALLLVRDLLVGPRRFTDLARGLPRIPSNVLSTRLRELEEAGVIERRLLPRPTGSVVYALTDRGRALEDAVIALGRWGAEALGDPGEGEVITVESMTMALRTTFDRAAARGPRAVFELRMGEVILHATIAGARLEVAPGPAEAADLVIHAGPGLRRLMAGELTPAAAIEGGVVAIEGDPRLLERFAEVFRIGPPRAPRGQPKAEVTRGRSAAARATASTPGDGPRRTRGRSSRG
ncbi:MAG: winged helix-turn-helix transcriptional regulator [Nannocystaceae bacterium]